MYKIRGGFLLLYKYFTFAFFYSKNQILFVVKSDAAILNFEVLSEMFNTFYVYTNEN